MGNSPSFGLGGGSAHSSRDVRRPDPEKEINRPIASRAPTYNKYTEIPAARKPHTYTTLNKLLAVFVCPMLCIAALDRI